MIKKNDFIAVDYVGSLKESGKAFDLTSEESAKKEEIYDKNFKYGPKIICVGQGYVVKGLDEAFIGKEIGKDYSVEISAENAFGKKDSSLIKTVPAAVLEKQNIRPFPGLVIDASGMRGIIRQVGAGRAVIDFNHPLAGKGVVYEFRILKMVIDRESQIKSLLKEGLGLNEANAAIEIAGKEAKIKTNIKLQEIVKKRFSEKCSEILGDLKVTFV